MANVTPNVSYSFTMRLRIRNRVGMLARVLRTIAREKGAPGGIDLVRGSGDSKVRDVTVNARDDAHAAIGQAHHAGDHAPLARLDDSGRLRLGHHGPPRRGVALARGEPPLQLIPKSGCRSPRCRPWSWPL